MANPPVIPPPIEVRLQNLTLYDDNSIRVWLALEDESSIALDFAPESAASARLLDTITQIATEALSRLGERGIVVTGFTPPEIDEDEEE